MATVVCADEANRSVVPLRTTRSFSSAMEVPDNSIAKSGGPGQCACGPKKRPSQHAAALVGGVPPSSGLTSVKGPMLSRKGRNAEQPAHCKSKRIGRDGSSTVASVASCDCTWPESRSNRSSPLQLAQPCVSRDVEAAAASAVAKGFAWKAHTRPWTAGSHS